MSINSCSLFGSRKGVFHIRLREKWGKSKKVEGGVRKGKETNACSQTPCF